MNEPTMMELEEAAKTGDAESQLALGVALWRGNGVPADPVAAVRWLKLASEAGHTDADCYLGIAYFNGRGVGRDEDASARHLSRAAHAGHAHAQYLYARLLLRGARGAEKEALAVSWFRRAAEQGSADASAHLGWMQVEGKAGTGDESQEGLARLEEAANGGSAMAQELLARCFLAGVGVAHDRERAAMLLRAATLNGGWRAAREFACAKDTSFAEFLRARSWLAEAARAGDREAQFWQNRVLFARYSRAVRATDQLINVLGTGLLIYHLATQPFRLSWLALALSLGAVLAIGAIAFVLLMRTRGEATVNAEYDVSRSSRPGSSFKELWSVPAEDGMFVLPLFYLGVSPLNAAGFAALFALIHYPTYATWSVVPKGVSNFLIILFILPRFGIWPIVVGHLLLDFLLIGVDKIISAGAPS